MYRFDVTHWFYRSLSLKLLANKIVNITKNGSDMQFWDLKLKGKNVQKQIAASLVSAFGLELKSGYFLICVKSSGGGLTVPPALPPNAEKPPLPCWLLKAPNPPPSEF